MKDEFIEYWTLFYCGLQEVICSKHESIKAAEKAASTCEKRGGLPHRIIEVKTAKDYDKKRFKHERRQG